uniref:NADH-ubiquinone oxidoreductase chain 3 n=1 Tax=Micropterix calthella TaxID=41027 RepID=A0A076E842_9NEOP|nr:NADH dehydrogenase subunit 3 [Micropterix calthella]
MNLLLFIFIFLNLLIYMLYFISMMISKKSFKESEKLSSFECGFNSKFLARIPFSLHFFFICVIFLIFDIEITLLFPIIFNMNYCNNWYWIILWIYFFLLMSLSLMYEWNQGMLNWFN